ncbi:glycosyltransferase involved in cell wall biosynthesis [Scopulibacillus daqui]|uniref:Glycosyltransferase involved in cell wall biosynthesis n=2 Tax=Scopulibacillus daqui TaxID=1469162 RepID=A0ABS2Q2E7_9BACL|nr:glycosyltransferase involved in cell wall biosynthesis [Scopulibacillus daqui]
MDPHFDIKLIDLPSNVGFSGSLNIGYFLSSGEFIAVHDGDDISHPERLERQIKFLKDNPDIDLVGTNYSYFPTGDFSNQTKANWLKFGDDILKTYAHGGHCVCHGTILFRGKVFDQLGGPTRRVKGAEDYEFIVKFLNAQLKIDNLPEVLYYYRSHPNQRSRQFFTKASDKQ